jgi:hypothetical protein
MTTFIPQYFLTFMTCLICSEDCDHLLDVKKATKDLEGFQGYVYENITCQICHSLILEPMVMDNGHLIDRVCFLECLRSPGGYDPQRPVKVAIPSVSARDEISRLLHITYGRQILLPPIGDAIYTPKHVPECQAFREAFNEVLERRRFRLSEILDPEAPTGVRDDVFEEADQLIQTDEVVPIRARDANWRAARLIPRNEEVTLEEPVVQLQYPVREGATPRRFYRTFLNQNENSLENYTFTVLTGPHLTPETLFDSDATVDLTEDESVDLRAEMSILSEAEQMEEAVIFQRQVYETLNRRPSDASSLPE